MQTTTTTTVWSADFSGGTSPSNHHEWVRVLNRDGAVGTGDTPTSDNWRNVAATRGVVQHDDWTWAASRFEEGSMAAYYENGSTRHGEPFGGRWMHADRDAVLPHPWLRAVAEATRRAEEDRLLARIAMR